MRGALTTLEIAVATAARRAAPVWTTCAARLELAPAL
jgi:hypothetical protein